MLPITYLPLQTMALPPTGSADSYWRKSASKQSRPYDVPTSYVVAVTQQQGGFGAKADCKASFSGRTSKIPPVITDIVGGSSDPFVKSLISYKNLATNEFINRIKSKRAEEASLGVSIGEYREAWKLMADRTVQMWKLANALRKLRFYDAAEILGLVRKSPPKRRRFAKNRRLYWAKHPVKSVYYVRPRRETWLALRGKPIASLWLEYSFGWAPMVSDLAAAQKVLERDPFVSSRLYARVKPPAHAYDYSTWSSSYEYYYVFRTQMEVHGGGTYRVDNPNFDLSQRMGLTDPLSVALELTKFSFVWASWLTNFDDWLSQAAPGMGNHGLRDTWIGYKLKGTANTRVVRISPKPNKVETNWTTKQESYKRSIGGLPGVTLALRSSFIPSFNRAMNASSLLVLLFSGRKG